MVDTVDLILLQRSENLGIQRFGRRQIVAERFFNHYPTPSAVSLRYKARGAKPGDCHAEKAIRDGEVEKIVTCGTSWLIQLHQMFVKPAVGLWIVEITLQIAHAVGKPLPRVLVNTVNLELAFVPDEFFHCIGEASAPFLRAFGGAVDADELEAVGQLPGGC